MLSQLVISSHIYKHRSTSRHWGTDPDWWSQFANVLKARHVLTASIKSLTATYFSCFTKTICFSINFGKQITSQNFDDSNRNMASDFPCGLHSKTADVHSSINHLGYSLPAQLRCFVKKTFYTKYWSRDLEQHTEGKPGFAIPPFPNCFLGFPPVSSEASPSDTVTLLRQHLQQLRDIFPESFSLQVTPPQKSQKWGGLSSPSADKGT